MSEVVDKINQSPVTCIGRLIYYFFPYRRKVIKKNIDQVFGSTLNVSQKKRLIQAFYSHLATSCKEILCSRLMGNEMFREQVEVRGHEHMLAIHAKGQGILVLTGHFGNWECAPIGGILNFKQFQGKFHFIRRTFRVKIIERIAFRRYHKMGLRVIPAKGSLPQVMDALDENNAVVFVFDQHADLYCRDGVAVEFFGKKAGTYRSLASISRHTGVPVVPAASYRLPNGRHILEFYEPIAWQEYDSVRESIYRNTLAYNQALERIILANPAQWSWLHKRWKLDPLDPLVIGS